MRKIVLIDCLGILGTLVLLLTPCIIFAIFIIPQLSIFLAIPTFVFLGISLLTLGLVFILDPGYIPLNLHSQNSLQEEALQSLPEEYPFVQSTHFGQDRVLDLDGVSVECKYCFTCQSIRPPRTFHCSNCERCIYGHDHHCPWTGNCIGYRNYKYFFLFVINTSILAWFVFICTIVKLVKILSDPQDANITTIGNHLESILIILYTFLMGSSLGYLAGYHCYLVSQNLTTHEQIRGKYSSRLENPFNQGLYKNFRVLCQRVDPLVVNFDYWNQKR